ncbi:DUF3130 family protein [Listeria monocytogenes]
MEAIFPKDVSNLSSKSDGSYLSLKGENMVYLRASSIHQLWSGLIHLVNVVEAFHIVFKHGAPAD